MDLGTVWSCLKRQAAEAAPRHPEEEKATRRGTVRAGAMLEREAEEWEDEPELELEPEKGEEDSGFLSRRAFLSCSTLVSMRVSLERTS